MNRDELIIAQQDYCKEHDLPIFAPSDGHCWKCGRDIVDDEWATELITGCKHCNISYCD